MSRTPLARVALLVSVCTVTATGCTVAVDPARVLTGALVPFDACDNALDYFQEMAADRVGPQGLAGVDLTYGTAIADGPVLPVPGRAASGSAEADAAAGDVGTDVSGTNVQEAGVDEPDIVKTDGTLIVSVVDGVFRVIDAAAAQEVGRLELTDAHEPSGVASSSVEPAPVEPGPVEPAPVDPRLVMPSPAMATGPTEVLLDGDHALVLLRGAIAGYETPRVLPGWSSWQTTRLVSVDLSDPAHPTKIASLDLDGVIVSARLVDGVVRVAVRTQPAVEFPYDEELEGDDAALTARNKDILDRSELTDWLPTGLWSDGGGPVEELLVPCDQLSYPEEFGGFSTVSVLSLAIDGDLREPAGVGVVGSGNTVYASTDRFYVVTDGWGVAIPNGMAGSAMVVPGGGRMIAPVEDQRTGIHAFDISSPGPAQYVGSGQVQGHLLGQYALSEWEGSLRVASTTDGDWSSGGSESRLTVLAEQDGELVQIGMVDGLGTGEEIYAVRYVGPTAYVVTFRQTDPLYVIDVGDPTEPVVRGELKVTGYSAYLHPVAPDRVVGVGQQARRTGTTVGAQVSLFDVSDPTAPAKLDGAVVRNGWSEAENDARAFLYWEPTGELVIPMTRGNRTGALVVSVADDTLTEVGWVTSSESAAALSGQTVRRSIIIGDRLFTVWPDGVQSNELVSLRELAWVAFS